MFQIRPFGARETCVFAFAAFFALNCAPVFAQTLTVNSVASPDTATAVAGTRVEAAVAGGPGNTTDFVALYPAGAAAAVISTSGI